MDRNLVAFTQAQRDGLIAMSLGRQQRNLFGDLGPRCHPCSGLGSVLMLGGGDRGVTRSTTKCRCEGSGIDLERLERASNDAMWQRINELERRLKLPVTSTYKMPTIVNSRQYWMECIAWATASGTAIANSTTETILFPNVTIPANYMQDGRSLRATLMGGYGTTGTPTIIFSVRWGGVSGTVMAKSSTVTLTSGVGGGASMTALWTLVFTINVRSNGSSGTAMLNGLATMFTSTAGTAGTVTNYGMPVPLVSGSTGGTTPATSTCDFTADTALSITALWGTQNAANSIQGHQYNLESLN